MSQDDEIIVDIDASQIVGMCQRRRKSKRRRNNP